ncbi:MAG TPA: hypothetical protein PKD91_10740 [Bacteroidia bacterium]|nr:hypothetical protein [Bacteroidia bacterium]
MSLTTEYFNETYRNLFEKTFHVFRDRIKNTKNAQEKYCMFYPTVGLNYQMKQGFLLVGRATNGWTPAFDCINEYPKFMKECSEYSKMELVSGKCPLQWVDEKLEEANDKIVANRSPFFQVGKAVIQNLYPATKDVWTHNVSWSNLYKIAPAEGGNPSTTDCDAQWPGVKYLFEMEVEQLQPKYILIISGTEWSKDFIGSLEKYNGKYVEEIGWYKGAKVVVCSRPEQKPRGEFIEEVLQAFSGIAE